MLANYWGYCIIYEDDRECNVTIQFAPDNKRFYRYSFGVCSGVCRQSYLFRWPTLRRSAGNGLSAGVPADKYSDNPNGSEK